MFAVSGSASAAIRWESLNAKPKYEELGGATPPAAASSATIPYFTDTFRTGGQTYTYRMVGTDPDAGAATTTVPTTIIPLRLHFADGTILNGASRISGLTASPLFQPANFISGRTQYGDAIQRAEFWSSVAGTDYHVLLRPPTTRPVVNINIPAEDGVVAEAANGHKVGLVKYGWFGYHVIVALQHQLNMPADVLPIYLTKDVVLYVGHPNNCCVIGFHGAQPEGFHTYIWGSYMTPGFFRHFAGITDVNPLSHEVSEWYNDPFVNNIVPEWYSPLAPQYGCSPYLEDGDPLVGVHFSKNGYSLQDEAFFSWFARDRPSQGINGWYTYLNTFDSPSRSCS